MQKFYSIKEIWKSGATYLLLNGERSNGKSYSAKEAALKMAWTERDPFTKKKVSRYQFAYIRRREKEAAGSNAVSWLSDMPVSEITDGECDHMTYFNKGIYFATHDEDGKSVRVKECGKVFALAIEGQYKSLAFPKIGLLIFEEYITLDGYLPREIFHLENLVSTILRRDTGRVVLIGNTMSRACPYFTEWSLTNAIHQKPGTIDLYEHATDQVDEDGLPVVIRIAVELCENSGNNSKMFFGQSAKMITSGEWYSEDQPKLGRPYEEYEHFVDVGFYFRGIGFLGHIIRDRDEDVFLMYVEEWDPSEFPKDTRILSDVYDLNPAVTKGWSKRFKHDAVISNLIHNNKLAFSSNLTGTEFRQMIKENLL